MGRFGSGPRLHSWRTTGGCCLHLCAILSLEMWTGRRGSLRHVLWPGIAFPQFPRAAVASGEEARTHLPRAFHRSRTSRAVFSFLPWSALWGRWSTGQGKRGKSWACALGHDSSNTGNPATRTHCSPCGARLPDPRDCQPSELAGEEAVALRFASVAQHHPLLSRAHLCLGTNPRSSLLGYVVPGAWVSLDHRWSPP